MMKPPPPPDGGIRLLSGNDSSNCLHFLIGDMFEICGRQFKLIDQDRFGLFRLDFLQQLIEDLVVLTMPSFYLETSLVGPHCIFGHQVDDAVRNMLQQLLRNGDDAGIGQSF